jgi:hypothetical protein
MRLEKWQRNAIFKPFGQRDSISESSIWTLRFEHQLDGVQQRNVTATEAG